MKNSFSYLQRVTSENGGAIIFKIISLVPFAALFSGCAAFAQGVLEDSGTAAVIETVNDAATVGAGLSPELKASLNSHVYEPNILGIIFSLLLVISLIYLTGIAYQKLIKVNPRYLKSAKDEVEKNEFNLISTKQIGQGKYLHVVEVNGKFLVLGSTPNAINLLREFSKEEVI